MPNEEPGAGLEVRGIGRAGVAGAAFSVLPGRCLVIAGPSVSGKSILLRAVADLDAHAGEAFLDGRSREAMAATEWRRRVRYLPAEPGWWRERVGDHFTDPGAARDVLRRLDLPDEALDWTVDRLSTGERQRVALARALEGRPAVLLLDEPTSGLDKAAAARVEEVLRALLRGGTAMVLVTHDPDLAARLGDQAMTMNRGRLGEASG